MCALITVGFFVISLLIYGMSLGNGFVRWDDGMLIFENPLVRGITPRTIWGALTSFDPELYIPLTIFSYQLDFLIGGTNASIYHIHSLILHTLNAVLVSWLLLIFSRKNWVALLGGLFFLIHPVHTEAVAWASARKDVLSTLFFLLSILTYVSFHSTKSRRMYIWSVITLALGLAAKVMVISLPLVLLLIDYKNGRKINKKVLKEKLPHFIIAALFGIIALIGKTEVISASTFIDKVLMACKSTVFYIEKLFWPTKLSVLHLYPGEISFSSPDFYLPLVIVALILFVAFISIKTTKTIIFGAGFFFITLFPTFVNFAKGEDLDLYIASERYTYVPSIAVIYLVLMGLFWVISQVKKPAHRDSAAFLVTSILLIVMGSFSYVAHLQARLWEDSGTLFKNVVAIYPYSHVAHNNLGNMHRRMGDINKAITEYKDALELKPHARTLSNLASAYRAKGLTNESLAYYAKALELNPNFPQAHIGLGTVYASMGQNEKALNSYAMALQLDPDSFETMVNLGSILANTGNPEGAIEQYDLALAINPYYPHSHFNRGVALSKLGNKEEAIRAYVKTVKLEPSFIGARINLGILYYDQQEIEKAVDQFRDVLIYDPKNARAHSALQQIQQRLE